MYHGNCKCFHHGVVKALAILTWLSAFGFWWATTFKQTVFWMDSEHLFRDVVVLGILIFISKYCGCCRGGKCGGCSMCGTKNDNKMSEKMCSHHMGCKCGDCDRCH